MIRRPPRSTQSRSSAASDVYKRQGTLGPVLYAPGLPRDQHAQSQHLLRHAQARIGSAHACSALAQCPKPFKARGGCPPLPRSHLGPRPMLSMHELSLSVPEPILSLSMLMLDAVSHVSRSTWLRAFRPLVKLPKLRSKLRRFLIPTVKQKVRPVVSRVC